MQLCRPMLLVLPATTTMVVVVVGTSQVVDMILVMVVAAVKARHSLVVTVLIHLALVLPTPMRALLLREATLGILLRLVRMLGRCLTSTLCVLFTATYISVWSAMRS
jgi:hypothetical protein